jgi:protein SCO1/2
MIALLIATALINVDEHLGAPLPAVTFTDDAGRAATLPSGKPTVLVLAYMRCESLCDLVLRGLVDSLARSGLQPGADFHAVTVSIDPADTPAQAGLRKQALLQKLNQPRAEWPFLVGKEPEIRRLADALGFRYVSDGRQFAHPAVVFILTPDGRIARYLYGVQFRPLDLKLALAEASRGKVGGVVERVLLACYQWDPASRRYGLVVSGVMKGGAALVALALFAAILYLIRLERRR